MKTFEIYDYSSCKQAKDIENLINNCGSAKSHLKDLKDYFNGDTLTMSAFFMACVAYWSETQYYDGRNAYAVLHSRKVVEYFEDFTDLANSIKDEILVEAFGFTHSAHRYLQNELFKTILAFWEENGTNWSKWLNEMEFVYNENQTDLIPYNEYRFSKYGF